jgi:hypothetical protein
MERSWLVILMVELAAEAKKVEAKRLEDTTEELDWVDKELSDGNIEEWADWDILEESLPRTRRTGTMLDWLKKDCNKQEPMVEDMDIDMDGQSVMQLEKEFSLERAKAKKKEWLEPREKIVLEKRQRRKKALQKKIALVKNTKFNKEIEDIARSAVESWSLVE